MKAVLTAPITQTYAQKKQDVRLYFPGQWAYTDSDGRIQRLDVSIRTRGIFRREYCTLPPLQLNFKKPQTKGTLFANQDKLKLVSSCRLGARDQKNLVLEYLAYRSFEIISEYSLKTRLLRLSYVDSDEKKKPWTHLAFVIEEEADMAKRLGLKVLRLPSVSANRLNRANTALVELFQLMIANNDYSVLAGPEGTNCCHNIEILELRNSERGIVPVPYDFDASGLVNTGYALPPKQLPIRNVRRRYFKGRCQPREIWADAFTHFQSKRAAILALYANSEYLDDKNKAKTRKFTEEFYEIMDSPQRIDREIIGRCRG